MWNISTIVSVGNLWIGGDSDAKDIPTSGRGFRDGRSGEDIKI